MSPATPATPAAAPSFEEALTELEAIVAAMEGGQMPLEASLAAYQRGFALLQQCQAVLGEAQAKVRILEAGVLKAFEPKGEDDDER